MKRTFVLLTLAATAACGSRVAPLSADQAAPSIGGTTNAGWPSPPTQSPTPLQTPSGAATGGAEKPAASPGGATTTAAEPAPTIPRAGRYTIHVSGTRTAGSTGQPQPFEGDGTLDVAVSGADVTLDSDSPEGTEHLETRHTSRGVLLRRARIEQFTFTFDASFSPPQLIIRSPIRVGDDWTNDWTAEGTSGTSRFQVLREETITALGRSWRTFVIENRTTTTGDAKGTNTTTSWYSPELGLDLKRVSDFEGRYREVPFSQRSERVITAGR